MSSTTSIQSLVSLLTDASNAYYNGQTPIMDDDTYDGLLESLKARDPKHPFLSSVGAPVSGVSHPLPVCMPSLDKIKPGMPRLERFLKLTDTYVMSEKLDGLSALWIPSKRELYLRGDGRNGYLIPSGIVDHIAGLVQSQEDWIIRGELLMERSVELVNGRNIVNGLIHHTSPSTALLAKIQFLAYEVHAPTRLTRSEQFTWLADHSFMTPWWSVVTNPTEASCSEEFLLRRANSKYDTDGIVIGVNKIPVYPAQTTVSVQNPKDCVAFKMPLSDQSATTTLREIIWTPSAQGYLIPKLRFDPVVINGAKIEFCTGHNAKTVLERCLGPNAVIKIRRSGDVIPTLDDVIAPADTPSFPPPESWTWIGTPPTATHIHLNSVSDTQRASQLYHFAKTLEFPGFGPATAETLVKAGINSPNTLWLASEQTLVTTLGPKTGKTLYATLRNVSSTSDEMRLLLASNQLPRGVGESKLTSLFKQCPDPRNWLSTQIIPSGWTADTFTEFKEAFARYEVWRNAELSWIQYPCIKTDSKPAQKGTVCFTGFRDKALETQLKGLGYTISPTLTKSTSILLIPDEMPEESEKIKKARSMPSMQVITRSAFVKTLVTAS
jgi:NAD-dependent DNA ligase